MRLLLSLVMVLILPALSPAATFKELFEKEFLAKPWAGGERGQESVCLECHTSESMKPSYWKIPEEWRNSWHAENKISCHDCHGGDPKDAALSMSPQRGFVGIPKYPQVPEFCGKCHVGILKNYLESGHGKALKASGAGPNCVTCHGSHAIQKATIEIINEERCSRCHSYDRARVMKQALFATEKKMAEIEKDLRRLKGEGVFTEREDKTLFSTQAEFRTLFHTVDVDLVKKRSEEFSNKLKQVEALVQKTFSELRFRRNFSALFVLIFAGMGVVLFLLSRNTKQ